MCWLTRSPTVGEYDKLAIRYGYTHLQTSESDPGLLQILEDSLFVLQHCLHGRSVPQDECLMPVLVAFATF